jgi:hypothetical protein
MTVVQQLLEQLNLPSGDRHDHPTSEKRFPDGAHYRVEIPSTEGPSVFRAVIQEAQQRGVCVHRISQGSGIMLLTDAEIREMVALGQEHQMEVSLFVGPRAGWDAQAQPLTPDGKIMAWRHIGMDQVVYGFDDVMRAVDLGVRGVLSADEGLIYLLGEARRRGMLPPDFVLKGSALLGVANPLGIKLLVNQGMDTINVASSISIAQLAALRQVIDIPIDLYIEAPDGLGGFTRYHELPEIIRVAAPIYLKFGLRNAPGIYPSGTHLDVIAVNQGRERVRRAAIGMELLNRAAAEYVMSEVGAPGLGIPVVPSTQAV